jgi:hypothetical protein
MPPARRFPPPKAVFDLSKPIGSKTAYLRLLMPNAGSADRRPTSPSGRGARPSSKGRIALALPAPAPTPCLRLIESECEDPDLANLAVDVDLGELDLEEKTKLGLGPASIEPHHPGRTTPAKAVNVEQSPELEPTRFSPLLAPALPRPPRLPSQAFASFFPASLPASRKGVNRRAAAQHDSAPPIAMDAMPPAQRAQFIAGRLLAVGSIVGLILVLALDHTWSRGVRAAAARLAESPVEVVATRVVEVPAAPVTLTARSRVPRTPSPVAAAK